MTVTETGESADDAADIALAKVAPAPQLPYGVAVPIWRRRWLRRTVLWLLLLIGVVGLIRHFYGKEITRRIAFVREQRALLAFREKPSTVLYVQMPTLTYDTAGYIEVSPRQRTVHGWDSFQSKALDQTAFVDDSDLDPGGGARPAGRQYNELVFLHQRTSPNGTVRLVEVGVSMRSSRRGVELTARVRLFEPGSVWDPQLGVVPVANRREGDGGIIPAWPGGVFKLYDIPFGHWTALYAGQPHPDDESGFLIPYALDDQSGVIRGRLLDGDRVVFEGRPRVDSTQPARREVNADR
jgi:hypothetical protein